MIGVVALPVVLALLLARSAPSVARRCRPDVATVLFTVLTLSTALLTGVVLGVVACLGLGEIPALGRVGSWSAPALAQQSPMPVACGAVAAAVLLLLLVGTARHLLTVVRRGVDAARMRRALDPTGCGLAVLDDDGVGAFALPGRRGLVVVSRGLLGEFTAAERRAVIAHENAHLRFQHVRVVQLADLAAALNPLLRPVAAQVRLSAESWADAAAARTVGDPVVVAWAIARTALARRRSGGVAGAPAIDGGDVAARVACLMAPPSYRPAPAIALASCTAVVAAGVALFALDAHAGFEFAQAAFAGR